MREEPIDGEEVELIVTAVDDEQRTSLEAEIERVGGSVVDRLQFGALRVELVQERIDDLCTCSGIESIETRNAIGMGGDAGEDVEEPRG
jgi:diphthamide synthase (EF-2-diphthine--ammonia ligase)